MTVWTPDLQARAEALLDDGCSYRETARTLGVDHTTVRDHLPGRGWTRQQVGSWAAGSRWGRR